MDNPKKAWLISSLMLASGQTLIIAILMVFLVTTIRLGSQTAYVAIGMAAAGELLTSLGAYIVATKKVNQWRERKGQTGNEKSTGKEGLSKLVLRSIKRRFLMSLSSALITSGIVVLFSGFLFPAEQLVWLGITIILLSEQTGLLNFYFASKRLAKPVPKLIPLNSIMLMPITVAIFIFQPSAASFVLGGLAFFLGSSAFFLNWRETRKKG